jgi:hypothetical protein
MIADVFAVFLVRKRLAEMAAPDAIARPQTED